jgi:hypothetical protein
VLLLLLAVAGVAWGKGADEWKQRIIYQLLTDRFAPTSWAAGDYQEVRWAAAAAAALRAQSAACAVPPPCTCLTWLRPCVTSPR